MKNRIIYFFLIVVLSGFLTACEDFFSPNPDDILLEKDYPSTATELYSGFMGLAAKTQSVADQAGFLEGLRGDFLEPTYNSTTEIIELYNYEESGDNELADPKGYYDIVLNVNDYIQHAIDYHASNPKSLDSTIYQGLISGAMRYKAWAYIMLAKVYGTAIWIDEPFTEYEDISQYPEIGFNEIITRCISLLEDGIDVDGQTIDGKNTVRWSTVLFPGQGESSANLEWNRICPPPECLLAELYLFNGDYQLVFDNLLQIIREGGLEASYQLNLSEHSGEWINIFNRFYRKESIFMFTFNYELNQTNRLNEFYSNLSPNRYLLKPTEAAMHRFSIQVMNDQSVGDDNRGENKTYRRSNGEWIVNKFSNDFRTSDRVYRNDVLITLYRASDLYLWLTEALGQMGRFEEAIVFLDGGIETYYDAGNGVFQAPFEEYPTTLYQTSSRGDRACAGIRGRVDLYKIADGIVKNPSEDVNQDKRKLDSLLVEETLLESAGEARGLYTMIRMAKRWNDPAIVADRVSAKYPEGQREAIRSKLMNPENWFIKFDLQNK